MKALIFPIFFALSCASVTLELEPPSRKRVVSFIHYSHYGLFGLVGSDSLNIQSACMEGRPVQIKNYFHFEDFLFIISTLGLYFPKSTKIWCKWPSADNNESDESPLAL